MNFGTKSGQWESYGASEINDFSDFLKKPIKEAYS
jgi:hypothetical protein